MDISKLKDRFDKIVIRYDISNDEGYENTIYIHLIKDDLRVVFYDFLYATNNADDDDQRYMVTICFENNKSWGTSNTSFDSLMDRTIEYLENKNLI